MSRIHNFSAGPAVLPEPVLREAQEALLDVQGSGMGILECSHRSALFDGIIESAEARLRRLLNLSDQQRVLFLHGGARTQFFMLPLNILQCGRATYLDTGTWSTGAAAQARRYGTVDMPFSSAETRYDHVPQHVEAPPEGTVYLHYTSNNTVAGTEYAAPPDVDVPLVVDASSNILSRPMDGSRFHFLYAGAQKNMGPAGVTFVVIHDDWVARCADDVPEMLSYPIHVKKSSMYNTPCTFAIYMVERVAAWVEEQGGPTAMEARNQAQADALYGQIDRSGFWAGKARRDSRSRMNVTFTTGDDELDTRFWKEAAEQGLSGLKGHRSVGGLRASLYNAQSDAAVAALVDFMKDFEARNG